MNSIEPAPSAHVVAFSDALKSISALSSLARNGNGAAILMLVDVANVAVDALHSLYDAPADAPPAFNPHKPQDAITTPELRMEFLHRNLPGDERIPAFNFPAINGSPARSSVEMRRQERFISYIRNGPILPGMRKPRNQEIGQLVDAVIAVVIPRLQNLELPGKTSAERRAHSLPPLSLGTIARWSSVAADLIMERARTGDMNPGGLFYAIANPRAQLKKQKQRRLGILRLAKNKARRRGIVEEVQDMRFAVRETKIEKAKVTTAMIRAGLRDSIEKYLERHVRG